MWYLFRLILESSSGKCQIIDKDVHHGRVEWIFSLLKSWYFGTGYFARYSFLLRLFWVFKVPGTNKQVLICSLLLPQAETQNTTQINCREIWVSLLWKTERPDLDLAFCLYERFGFCSAYFVTSRTGDHSNSPFSNVGDSSLASVSSERLSNLGVVCSSSHHHSNTLLHLGRWPSKLWVPLEVKYHNQTINYRYWPFKCVYRPHHHWHD